MILYFLSSFVYVADLWQVLLQAPPQLASYGLFLGDRHLCVKRNKMSYL